MATKKAVSKNGSRELKYLGFIKIAAIKTLIVVTNLYEYVKANSGSLGSGVSKVESTVASITSPLRPRIEGAAEDLLVFLDREVDEAARLYDKRAPPLVKTSVSQAQVISQRMSQLFHVLTTKVQADGIPGLIHMASSNYRGAVEEKAARIWFALNQVPPFHMVTDMAIPTAAHWSEKYNHLVMDMTQKGYTIFSYFPLVPLDRIAKVFRRMEVAEKEASAPTTGEGSESD